jgi:quinoprotein glucose dehydrogenase
VKPHFAGIIALAALGSAGAFLFAQNAKPDKTKGDPVRIDFSQLETPRKPLPKWIAADKDGKQVFVDQGQFDPRLKGYFTPEGLKVEIVAEAPAVVNPVGMTFGDDGTLYVLEWLPGTETETAEEVKYKDGTTRKIATVKKSVKDVVKVLRDTKGAGVYDEAKVLLEEDLPSSILVHDGWVYLSGRGTVRRYRLEELQAKPQAAKAEVIAQGFCAVHHRQVSGLTIGNDGWLYITSGDNDNYVEGSDGSRATVLRTGGVFRCRPDGSRMHVYAIGFRNPYRDLAFDATFNGFHLDNDAEAAGKFAGCRLMHVAEESDYGWRLAPGTHGDQSDVLRGAVWGELPGKLTSLAKTGRGGPAGLLIYNDSYFPANYRGLLLYPDVVRKSVRAYQVGQNGSTFELVSEFELLKSDDPLFRPCQMVTGPDGAIYVCDWRKDLAGKGEPSGNAKNGRIFRLTWAGTKDEPAIARRGLDSWAKLAKLPNEELLKTLSGPNFSDRLKAQQLLVKKGAEVRNPLLDLLEEPKQPLLARVAALGALNSLWNEEVRNVFLSLLYAGEPDLRRLVAEGLALNCKPGDADADATFLQVLGDQDFAARRAIILAMGRVGGPSAPDALANTFKSYKDNDPFLLDAILRAIERLDKRGVERLVALAQSGVEKDFDRVVDAFLGLRVRAAADAIPELLNYPHLTIPQRVNLLKSYSNYVLDPPVSLAPVVKYLERHKDEPIQVRLAALEVLTMPGQPRNEKVEDLALPLLEQSDAAFRLALIRVVENGRLARAAPILAKLLTDAERSVEERTAVAKALGVLGDKAVVPALKELATAKPAAGAEALRLESLRSLAALDVGLGQTAAQQLLMDTDRTLQTEAVLILGAKPEGAKVAGEAFLAKKLPKELLPQVSEVLRKHADKNPDLAKLLAEVQKQK